MIENLLLFSVCAILAVLCVIIYTGIKNKNDFENFMYRTVDELTDKYAELKIISNDVEPYTKNGSTYDIAFSARKINQIVYDYYYDMNTILDRRVEVLANMHKPMITKSDYDKEVEYIIILKRDLDEKEELIGELLSKGLAQKLVDRGNALYGKYIR